MNGTLKQFLAIVNLHPLLTSPLGNLTVKLLQMVRSHPLFCSRLARSYFFYILSSGIIFIFTAHFSLAGPDPEFEFEFEKAFQSGYDAAHRFVLDHYEETDQFEEQLMAHAISRNYEESQKAVGLLLLINHDARRSVIQKEKTDAALRDLVSKKLTSGSLTFSQKMAFLWLYESMPWPKEKIVTPVIALLQSPSMKEVSEAEVLLKQLRSIELSKETVSFLVNTMFNRFHEYELNGNEDDREIAKAIHDEISLNKKALPLATQFVFQKYGTLSRLHGLDLPWPLDITNRRKLAANPDALRAITQICVKEGVVSGLDLLHTLRVEKDPSTLDKFVRAFESLSRKSKDIQTQRIARELAFSLSSNARDDRDDLEKLVLGCHHRN